MRLLLTVIALLMFASDSFAGPLVSRMRAKANRQRVDYRHETSTTSSMSANGTVRTSSSESTTIRTRGVATVDALDEVNAARARRGLPPFARDEALTQAAEACARVRAMHRIAGHTANDFAYLPPGASAKAAGCGALAPWWGWQSCCTYDRYTTAGAAVVIGSDGRRYMSIFVR